MAIKNEKGDWIDSAGRLVPAAYVTDVDKKRDKLVEALVKDAEKAAKILSELKAKSLLQIEKYMDQLEKIYNVKARTSEGNKRLSNFSNSERVELHRAKYIDFDERLNLAKSLIDECINQWVEGSDDKIRALIEQAFQVNEQGRLNKDRVLGLQKLNFKDKKWKKAMKLINESIKVIATRDYIRFARKDESGEWVSVVLDIARC